MSLNRGQIVTEVCDIVGKSENAIARSTATLQSRVRTYLNWALRKLTRAHNFWELDADQNSAATVDGVHEYPMVSGTNNLGLTRPKGIYSIRLIDDYMSRKLIRKSYREFDNYFPYPANYAEARTHLYMRRGDNLFFFRIPDDAYTLYIRYFQWHPDLELDATEPTITGKDDLIVAATVLETYMNLQEYKDAKIWYEMTAGILRDVIKSEEDMDDRELKLQEFRGASDENVVATGEYWNDPWTDTLSGYQG